MFRNPALDYKDYRSILKHVDLTHKKEQHFECLWLCYALAESRIAEVRLGLALKSSSHQSLVDLQHSIAELVELQIEDAHLKIVFGRELLQQLLAWVKSCKAFFEQFSNGASSTDDLHQELQSLARLGRRLTRQLVTSVRAFKRNTLAIAR